ncbi:hypothetical protein L9F63_016738, partial [Diploptera punctata]
IIPGSIAVKMGGWLTALTGGNLDVPDPATGLTPREKNCVRRNWDLVKADIKQNGIDLLMLFFEDNPSYQNYFKAFKDVPFKELPKNPRFHAHCTSVMYALTSVVDNLDDPECLVEMLSKLGENHQRRGINRQEFINLKSVVIKLFKTKLGIEVHERRRSSLEQDTGRGLLCYIQGNRQSSGRDFSESLTVQHYTGCL